MSFTKKRKIKPEFLESPAQRRGREFLEGILGRPFEPYTGKRFAEYPYKEQLSRSLEQYISRQQPDIYGIAQTQLEKTIGGEIDPFSSPYYGGIKSQLLREEQEGLNRLRRGAQLGGMLYSSPRQEAEAELIGQTTGKLMEVLGRLSEAERQRQLSAIPLAMEVARAIEQQPLETARAITVISPILKAIEEEPLAFNYEQFLRKQQYPFQQARIANILYSTPATAYTPKYLEEEKDWPKWAALGTGALASIITKNPTYLTTALGAM